MSEDNELHNAENVEKQRTAAFIAKAAFDEVLAAAVPGALLFDLCQLGDAFITREMAGVELTDKDEEAVTSKGICFPTCVTVNNYFAHYSPSSGDKKKLKKGDVMKIEMGAQIDGMIGMYGETRVCGVDTVEDDDVARLLTAVTVAGHAALHALRPGATNSYVTQVIQQVADAFQVKAMQNHVAYQLKRYVVDGRKQIWMAAPEPGSEPLECREVEFEAGEAYCMDIRFSTGTGTLKLSTEPTTIYKRDVDVKYMLKTKAARLQFRDINHNYPVFPFALRFLKDQRTARLGVKEMANHEMLQPYEVTSDKNNKSFVACLRFTIQIVDGTTHALTELPDPGQLPDDFELPAFVQEVLALDLNDHNVTLPQLEEPVEFSENAVAEEASNMMTD